MHEPARMGADVGDVLDYIRGLPATRTMFTDADEKTATAAIDAIATALRPHETGDGVLLGSAAWLVTARR